MPRELEADDVVSRIDRIDSRRVGDSTDGRNR